MDFYPEDDIDLPANPYIPSDMPDSAWTVPNLLLGYPDANANGTGIENIGQPNITYSDSKIKELRRAYYAASSFADQQIGRVIQELNSRKHNNCLLWRSWHAVGRALGVGKINQL